MKFVMLTMVFAALFVTGQSAWAKKIPAGEEKPGTQVCLSKGNKNPSEVRSAAYIVEDKEAAPANAARAN